MLKALKIEPELCTGCLQCELACSYENEGVFKPGQIPDLRCSPFTSKGS